MARQLTERWCGTSPNKKTFGCGLEGSLAVKIARKRSVENFKLLYILFEDNEHMAKILNNGFRSAFTMDNTVIILKSVPPPAGIKVLETGAIQEADGKIYLVTLDSNQQDLTVSAAAEKTKTINNSATYFSL